MLYHPEIVKQLLNGGAEQSIHFGRLQTKTIMEKHHRNCKIATEDIKKSLGSKLMDVMKGFITHVCNADEPSQGEKDRAELELLWTQRIIMAQQALGQLLLQKLACRGEGRSGTPKLLQVLDLRSKGRGFSLGLLSAKTRSRS